MSQHFHPPFSHLLVRVGAWLTRPHLPSGHQRTKLHSITKNQLQCETGLFVWSWSGCFDLEGKKGRKGGGPTVQCRRNMVYMSCMYGTLAVFFHEAENISSDFEVVFHSYMAAGSGGYGANDSSLMGCAGKVV